MKLSFYLLMTTFFYTQVAWADNYKIIHQKGQVEITRNNLPVALNSEVKSGDVIKVKKGMLILKNSKEVIKIFKDTIITPFEKEDETIIQLAKGAIVSMVTKKKFQVKTTNSVLGVRGTKFFVQATGKDDLWMCVEEGVVNVATKGAKVPVDVPAGKGVFIGPKDISPPKAYAWTKGINWKMNPSEGELDHKIKLEYDLLNNFYD